MDGKSTSPLITKLLYLYTEFMNDGGNVSLIQEEKEKERTRELEAWREKKRCIPLPRQLTLRLNPLVYNH